MKTSAFRFGACAAALIAATLACSCSNLFNSGSTPPAAYATYLYMTDTTNGHVYTYNPATHVGSSLSLLTTSSNAAGEIKFYLGIGYVAMGYGGIYYFDPSKSVPTATSIPGSSGLDAEYFAFDNSMMAYVSSYGSGLYTFNPSSPGSGISSSPVTGTSNLALQEVIVGPDGMIYAANTVGTVLKINPATNIVLTTFTTSAGGSTGLVSGTYQNASGIFVANTGGYGPAPNYNLLPGSIDFINTSSGILSNIVPVSTTPSIYPGRLIQLPNGNLVATGGAGHTYLIALGTTATVNELKIGNGTFGSFSIAYNSSSGLVYVPNNIYGTSNQLYVFDANGNQQAYSPVSVMTPTDNIANVAFYQD